MSPDEQLSRLRSAVYVGDGTRVVEAIAGNGLADDMLQLAGDGVLAALDQRVDDAPALAARLVTALRQRDWDGDAALADQLDAAPGDAALPMLRRLPVDLDELASVLEGDPTQGGGRIEVTTGQVWPASAIEYAIEMGEEDESALEDPQRWLGVECHGSRASYHDMEWFITTVDDESRADRLSIAIQGNGAFRRFKDVLARWPGELDRWHAFSQERQRGRAREWLADAGYRVVLTRKDL
jgi:hypothetical protein